MTDQISFDAILPPAWQQSRRLRKESQPESRNMFALAVLAGAFIGLAPSSPPRCGGRYVHQRRAGAAAFSTGFPYAYPLLVGLVFSVGLILVVVGGAELFTAILSSPWHTPARSDPGAIVAQLGIVYAGNLVGSVLTAYIVFLGNSIPLAVAPLDWLPDIGEPRPR